MMSTFEDTSVLNTICRLCIKIKDQGTMSPIFHNENYKETTLPERIRSCASLEVFEDDGLPSHICQKCLLKLNQSFVFRSQCVLADNTLRELLKNVTNTSLETFIHNLDIEADLRKTEGFDESDCLDCDQAAVVKSIVITNAGPETENIDTNLSNTETDENFTVDENQLETSATETEFHPPLNIKLSKRINKRKIGKRKHAVRNTNTFDNKAQKQSSMESCRNVENVTDKPKLANELPTKLGNILKKYKSKNEIRQSIRVTQRLRKHARKTNEAVSIPLERKMKSLRLKRLISEKVKAQLNSHEDKNDFDDTQDDIDVCLSPSSTSVDSSCKIKVNDIKKEKSENVEMVSVEPDVFGYENQIKKESSIKVENEATDTYWDGLKLLRNKVKGVQKQRGRPRKYLTPKDKPPFFKCDHCHKVYPSEGGWRYHIHTVHNENYQPFICDLCGKSFKVKKNLEGHKNSIHFHLKQHLCDLCGRGFASKYALKVHKIWHSDEKNFECDICGTKFRTRGKMNTHKTIHGGPKKFMCDVCSRNFRWKKDFEIHMRTHTGEKPYKCSHCGKAFSSLTNMKKHERNHLTGDHSYPQRSISFEEDKEYKANLSIPVPIQLIDDRMYKNDICNTNYSFTYAVEDIRNRTMQ